MVVGSANGKPGADAPLIEALFEGVVDQLRWVPFQEAEMLKALCNVFHALKVAFANEVGALCEALSLNGRAVMQHLVEDRKLNISPAYLRPGIPFGGSCLPKDLRMILSLGKRKDLELPLLRSVLPSNEAHLRRAIEAILDAGCHRIGLDGLSFKPGTDDLRESPMVQIAEFFLGKGFDLSIFDPAIETSRLTGANRDYINKHIPHLASRLVNDPVTMVERCEAIVFTREESLLREYVSTLAESPLVIDLSDRTRKLAPKLPATASQIMAVA